MTNTPLTWLDVTAHFYVNTYCHTHVNVTENIEMMMTIIPSGQFLNPPMSFIQEPLLNLKTTTQAINSNIVMYYVSCFELI